MSRSFVVSSKNSLEKQKSLQKQRGQGRDAPSTTLSRAFESKPLSTLSPSQRTASVKMQASQTNLPPRLENGGAAKPDNATFEKVGSSPSQAERRAEYRGAYTVIPPDEQKRQSIAQQADKEAQNYEKYKKKMKVNYVSYSGTVGGASSTEHQVRSEQQRQLKRAAPAARQRAEEYRRRTRAEQTRQTEAKRAGARRQAETNESREVARQARLDADRKRKNEAFLRRLEQSGAQ